MKLKAWQLPLVMLLAAGCVHYPPAPLSPDQTAAQFDARRLGDPGLKTFIGETTGQPPATWPPARWDLNDLTLAAFYFHPDLAVARAQWEAATAGVKTAGARPNPSISFSPSYDTQIPDNPSPWILPVTFDVPIETAGKRGKRLAEAEQAAESARLNFMAAAWQVRGAVRTSLMAFDLAHRRAGLLHTELADETQVVKLLQGQFEAGAVARPELTTAQIALNKLQLDWSAARAQELDARAALAQALGVSLAAIEGVNFQYDFPAERFDAPSVAQARTVALRERADVRAALADYAAAEADLRLQLAGQYPDLHLGPGYAWNSGNAGDDQWTLGATLELPILDQNQGPIAEALARRKLAAAKFQALQAQVCGQIDRATAGVREAREEMRTAKTLLDSENAQVQSIQAQQAAGAADQMDLLSARIEAANAMLTRLDSETKLLTAVAALEDALQQPADSLAAVIAKISREHLKGKEVR